MSAVYLNGRHFSWRLFILLLLLQLLHTYCILIAEAAAGGVLLKKTFLKNSQYS